MFWPTGKSDSFGERFTRWGTYLAGYCSRHEITDLVLFGDSRPYHRIAISRAKRLGIAVHILEEGYLRPDWITLEHGGSNALSSLPRSPQDLRETASRLPPAPARRRVAGGFHRRVIWDVAHHCVTTGFSFLYPNYVRHRPYHPVVEAFGWLARLAKRPWREQRPGPELDQWLKRPGKLFLFPLQLEADYQVRRHWRQRAVGPAIEEVMRSFSRNAPADALLLVKLHPLDNGLVDHRSKCTTLAASLGIGERVRFIDGGNMRGLIRRCTGVVVINSTTGLTALHHRRSVIALGDALYDVAGMTYQGPLDRFWTEARPADQTLFECFLRVLITKTQVNGSFFTDRGMALAVEGLAHRLGASSERQDVSVAAEGFLGAQPIEGK